MTTRASTKKLGRQDSPEIAIGERRADRQQRARGTGAPPEQFGPYIVFEQLGIGGMASVHRAETRGIAGFRKQVALKRMLPNVACDWESVQAFLEEAKLASHLHHQNIAQAFDLGKIGDTYYIAMELVPGPTLKQVIVQADSAAGAIPIPIVVEILSQLCDALDHAHNLCDDQGSPLGIIHRDVSPSNVIVSSAGVVKLIDFGIAKAASSSVRTETGAIKGKFGYVAPEYLEGRLDLRCDLFGLGVIAHELLTGRRLFLGANDYATVCSIREKPIQKPSRKNSRVSADLDDIVMTALQRDPDQRWQNARAMRVALGGVARELGVFVGGQQIRDYAEWAFSREPRASTSIVRLVDAIEHDFQTERSPVHRANQAPPRPPPLPPRARHRPSGTEDIQALRLSTEALGLDPSEVSELAPKQAPPRPPPLPPRARHRPSGTEDIQALRLSTEALGLDPSEVSELDPSEVDELETPRPRNLEATGDGARHRTRTQVVGRAALQARASVCAAPRRRHVSGWLILFLMLAIAAAVVVGGWIAFEDVPVLANR